MCPVLFPPVSFCFLEILSPHVRSIRHMSYPGLSIPFKSKALKRHYEAPWFMDRACQLIHFSLEFSNTEPHFADFQRIVPVFRPESDPSFSAEPPNPEPFRTLSVLPNSRIFYDRLLSYNLLLSAKSVIYPSSKNSSKCHVCCCCPVCPCIHFYSFTIILATFW